MCFSVSRFLSFVPLVLLCSDSSNKNARAHALEEGRRYFQRLKREHTYTAARVVGEGALRTRFGLMG